MCLNCRKPIHMMCKWKLNCGLKNLVLFICWSYGLCAMRFFFACSLSFSLAILNNSMERIIYRIDANQPTEPSHLHAQCNNRNARAICFLSLLNYHLMCVCQTSEPEKCTYIFCFSYVNPNSSIIRASLWVCIAGIGGMEKIKSK